MAAWINVDGGLERLDEYGLFYPSLDPVTFRCQYRHIFFSKVMVMFSGMLEHGGFVFTESIRGRGGMLIETSSGGSFCFTDISAWAWLKIGTSARYMVYYSYLLLFFELVFRAYKSFS